MNSENYGELIEWFRFFASGDSAIDRLAAALFVNRPNPEGRLMALFSAYFDASGTPDQPFLVMGGYIASSLQWKIFESQWKEIHREYGVNLPFHMSDFVDARRNPDRYGAQRKARRDYVEIAKDQARADNFFRKLSVLQATVVNCGVTCMVPMKLYNEVNSAFPSLREEIPPYALAARMCITKVHKWETEFGVGESVECIFEEGDLEQDKFTQLMRAESLPSPIYRKKEDYAGLQAADHYAWEQFHYRKKENTGRYVPDTALSILVTAIPYLNIEPTIETLVDLCRAKGIKPAIIVTK